MEYNSSTMSMQSFIPAKNLISPFSVETQFIIPFTIQCFNCKATNDTNVTKRYSAATWFYFTLLFVTGLWCMLCVPFITYGLHDYKHFCPQCKTEVAHRKARCLRFQ